MTVPAKPPVSTTENNVAGWSSTLKAILALNDGAGPPREVVSNGLAMYVGNVINGARTNSYLVKPTWTTGGFPYVSGGDKTLKFYPFSAGLQCPVGSGYTSGTLPAAKTQFLTFKVDWPPFNASHQIWLTSNDIGNGGASITLYPYTYGNHGAGAFRLSAWNQSTNLYPTNDLIVYPGRWYTAAWSHDLNGGAPNVKMDWYLYDWATGSTYEDHQTGLSVAYYSAGSTFAFNVVTGSFTKPGAGFVGELYMPGYDAKAWSSANFAAYVADPSAPVRGTAYTSSSGTLTPGQFFVGPCTATQVSFNGTRATGGITPHKYNIYAQLASVAGFTPGPGNLIVSDASTPSGTWTPPTSDAYVLKQVVTDANGAGVSVTQLNPASSVAAITQVQAATWQGPPVAVAALGDSITDNQGDSGAVALTALTGTEVHWYNIGVQGGTTGNGNGTSVGVGTYFLGTHGAPNAGAIPLVWNGNTTSGLAYNASASAVQTALAALPGWSGVTVTGGPLPTVCVIVPPAGIQASTYDLTIGSHTLTNAGGSPPAPWLRSQARLGSQMLAADTATHKIVRIHLGANDANGGDPTTVKTLISDNVAFYNSRYQKVVLHAGVPRSDANEGQAQNLAKYNDNLPVIVSTINDASKCVLGNPNLYKLASQFYAQPYFDAGRIHPVALYFGALQAVSQSLADAVALGAISTGGTYAAASDVRFNVDRGDGTKGTLVVPAPPYVHVSQTYDGSTVGALTLPPIGTVYSTQTYGIGGTGSTGTVSLPTPDKVLSPTGYGAGGTEFTGTATTGGGGSYPTTSEIATAVAGAILVTPANKLATSATGAAQLDLTQSVPTSNGAQTIGDALNAARAQGFGKWVIQGSNLNLYAPNGTTIVRSFTLDNVAAPTQRV